ncbi:hypothetical protein FACS189434_05100 [Bacteroidia bacterium]|nr:hypothetical protein FACS189434_05100 [Bacteroidia bacterium]
MKEENNLIEQQDLNVEKEVNEMRIEISEKSDKLMKRSITYLKIGFWSFLTLFVLQLISVLLLNESNGMGKFITLILVGVIVGFLLIKMYAYIGDYKIFRETKTQQALEDLLDAQKGYYGWIYVLPLILVVVAFVAFVLGDLLSAGR